MPASIATQQREFYETGSEPEYNICEIPKHEDGGNGLIRLYLASTHGKFDRIEYAALCTPETLRYLGLRCLEIADEYSEIAKFRKALSEH